MIFNCKLTIVFKIYNKIQHQHIETVHSRGTKSERMNGAWLTQAQVTAQRSR